MKTMSFALISVDRAMRDLRAGVPVIIHDDKTAVLVSAAEYDDESVRASFATFVDAPCELLLSAERASTLGWEDGAVRIDVDVCDADTLGAYVDPTQAQANINRPPTRPALAIDEACLRLAKYAEQLPALLIAPIDLKGIKVEQWALEHQLLNCPAEAILQYDNALAESIIEISEAQVPLADAGTFRIKTYRPRHGGPEHLALIAGEPEKSTDPVPIRLHSSCLTGDILGSLRCDCGEQLHKAIKEVGQAGCGIVLYLNQEGRGIGIANKLKAYQLQDAGNDTFDANALLGYGDDERDYSIAAAILKQLHVTTIKLMTNNPRKITQLQAHGITVAERLAHHVEANEVNAGYLETKRSKGGHLA